MNSKINYKAAVFVDGGHTFDFCLRNSIRISFDLCKKAIERKGSCEIESIRYYTSETERESTLRFHASLNRQGVQVVTARDGRKEIPCPHCNQTFTKKVQKGVDSRIIIDMMRAASQDETELIVLVSGDRDFEPVLDEIRNRLGKRVMVTASRYAVSPDLLGIANESVFLEEILDEIVLRPVAFSERNGEKGRGASGGGGGSAEDVFWRVFEIFYKSRFSSHADYGKIICWGFFVNEFAEECCRCKITPESTPLLTTDSHGRTKWNNYGCIRVINHRFGSCRIVNLPPNEKPWLIIEDFNLTLIDR